MQCTSQSPSPKEPHTPISKAQLTSDWTIVGALEAEHAHRLEHVADALEAHAVEHDAQRCEDARPADAGAGLEKRRY